MKTPARLLSRALMFFAGFRRSRNVKPLDALRQITIERKTILMLAGHAPTASDFCDWSGASGTLKPGTFGGAERISLSKTESGLISEFDFYYGGMSEEAVKRQIDNYTRLLGEPSRDSIAKSGQFDIREVSWSDSATTFELSYKIDGEETEGSAKLLDNALAGTVHTQSN